MKDIELKQVAKTIRFVNSLSFDEMLKIYDRIFLNQPHIFGHVVVLSHVNVPYEMIGHVLHLLLVFYLCFSDGESIKFPVLSEDELLSIDEDTITMLKDFEKHEPKDRAIYMKMSTLNYPEQNVFAYMLGYLKENGFTDENNQFNKYCIISAKNIFDCFCKLRRNYFEKD